MKRILSALLCTVLLCGCTNTDIPQKVDTVEPEKEIVSIETSVDKTMIAPVDDSWKYDVAERLYEEFCYFYEHRNDDMSKDEYYIDYGQPVQYHS